MITYAIKIIIGSALVLVIPGAAISTILILKKFLQFIGHSWIVTSMMRSAIFIGKSNRLFIERDHLVQKMDAFSESIAKEFSMPRVVLLYTALFASALKLFSLYYKETDIFNAMIELIAMSMLPLAALAVHFCRRDTLVEALNCPFCVWIRWTGLAILIWIGHSDATSRMSSHFLGASMHLPIAYSTGVFMSSIGILSLWTALFLLALQLLIFPIFGLFELKNKRTPAKVRIIAATTATAALLTTCLSYGAQNAIGMSDIETLAISKLKWEFDMLDEKACTGEDPAAGPLRKIVFVGPDQSKAYVFTSTWGSKNSSSTQPRPIRLLNKDERKAILPILEEVIPCNHAFSKRS
ncbi:hypothetical protein LGM57_37785 [Burkholderia cepacia]|uniref:hypothetical protein n=1 Tax=Burkholderia cepacia TaxID=292 RepID=UPI001CF1E063|nr:hypothetical protein [Burkholderia cepacia]MCA7982094.1 hypothetical protein [Burkholderia cepacia]